jgi:hypothetical protein
MKRGENLSLLLVLVIIVLAAVPSSATTVLFSETFDGYPYCPILDPGVPEIVEGADEYWCAARFEQYDGGEIWQDVSVRYGDYARFEDKAGILFNICTIGLIDITLDFDYKTHNLECDDKIVVGYYIGSLGFDSGENRHRDFYSDDFNKDNDAAENWWNNQWTELLRGRSCSWRHKTYQLPAEQEEIWVAFWMDGSECDYGKIDNITVTGVIPEPSTILLLGLGCCLLLHKPRCRIS